MKKNQVIKALFDNVSDLTADQVSQSVILKELLKTHVPEAIERALTSNKQYARVFEINSTGHFLEIPKKNWVPALDKCISFYVETDDYEQCSKLKALIERVQSKKPSIKVKKD